MKRTNFNSIGQSGEYLVASELCRRGFIAATFSRNMPGFDILAFNYQIQEEFRIQVKTIKPTGDWQLDAKNFLRFDLKLFDQGTQKIIGMTNDCSADYFVFVRQGNGGYGTDKFYILSLKQLKQIIKKGYGTFLKRINGKRPKNPKTTHIAIRDIDLEPYKNNWSALS